MVSTSVQPLGVLPLCLQEWTFPLGAVPATLSSDWSNTSSCDMINEAFKRSSASYLSMSSLTPLRDTYLFKKSVPELESRDQMAAKARSSPIENNCI